MAPHSASTKKSSGTVRTVSDVFDILEENKKILSLRETRKSIISNKDIPQSIAKQSIEEIESIKNIFSSITSIPDALVKLMLDTNTYMGGLQASSFFYPICSIVDAPWDFFCSSLYGNPSHFVSQIAIITMSETVETVTSVDKRFSIHILRRPMSAGVDPITIRVLISTAHPIDSVLDLKYTHQQCFISPVAAVNFWPKMISSKDKNYTVFANNGGLSVYPACKSKYKNKHSKMKRVNNILVDSIDIRIGLSKAETVTFKNILQLNTDKFNSMTSDIESIVYAVCNKGTKYLGNVSKLQ